MRKRYRWNTLTTQHIVEYNKFTNLLSTDQYCKRCGSKLKNGAPIYADECYECWENRTGGMSHGGEFGLADHLNADWSKWSDDIFFIIQYEYAVDCDYT